MTLILRFVRFQKHYLKVHSLHSIEEIWLKQLCYVKSQLCRNSYYNEEGRDDIKPGRAGMYATIIIVETLTVLEWHPGVSTLRKRKGKSAWVWPEEYSWFTPIGLLDRIRLDSRLPFGSDFASRRRRKNDAVGTGGNEWINRNERVIIQVLRSEQPFLVREIAYYLLIFLSGKEHRSQA